MAHVLLYLEQWVGWDELGKLGIIVICISYFQTSLYSEHEAVLKDSSASDAGAVGDANGDGV